MQSSIIKGDIGTLYPFPRVLYDSLQDHGFPENPVPGILYIPHPWWPPLGP